MTVLLVLNGPNLRRLGRREPAVYGTTTYDELVAGCERLAGELGVDVEVRQTDDEATMLSWLHAVADDGVVDGVVLNPAAWSHYSVAVRDAVAELTGGGVPVIEVHLSNLAAREPFRQASLVSPVTTGTITGLGAQGYHLALRALAAGHR